MQVLEMNSTLIKENKVISKHSYRPVLKLSWKPKDNNEDLCIEQMRTPEEQETCCRATD